MTTTVEKVDGGLYLRDETAWLDAMAEAARQRDPDALDWDNLAEYLSSMSVRDRRELGSRLAVLLLHLLKWEHQPEKRSRSWHFTLKTQLKSLRKIASSGVLRRYGEDVLEDHFTEAREMAYEEMHQFPEDLPRTCPYTFQELLEMEPPVLEE
jgi:hypothetical protein